MIPLEARKAKRSRAACRPSAASSPDPNRDAVVAGFVDTRWGRGALALRNDRVVCFALPQDRINRRLDCVEKLYGPVRWRRVADCPPAKLIQAYFDGEAADLRSVAVDYGPATSFRRRVWDILRTRVGFGRVVAYGWLARQAGRPAAARAVGAAMAANPIPLIVPCHRVVHCDLTPGGFSMAGGDAYKRRLLRHEGHGFAGGKMRVDLHSYRKWNTLRLS